ncbi:heme-dependent oxidative N-demethylase family protein [Oricola cellulosilytica]|uniref:DUF3445 domain-containing protein n=1 Tax=Oricola cellulosilytica TaxID=1429082 RepID=A0A4R0P6C5_9HYPH|nr:DUF3445 domain-containing protein [Oricola cellulosilytica]TCD11423.1 DUF3445 domain-containing protein [Oricola cellulosilytica]
MDSLPPPFSIGLTPHSDPASWLAPEDDLHFVLAEKDRLIAAYPTRVFMAEPGTQTAQREVAVRLRDHLTSAFADVYAREGDTVSLAGTGRRVRLATDAPRLLEDAARLVADDLVIMRRKPDGWTLVAASLCFPTFWKLPEKFGRPITEIHQPVPAFGRGTRNAALVERIFDRLRPDDTVQRSNWSVHADGALHHYEPHGNLAAANTTEALARLFLRREFQTLTKLPETGDLLFTIRVRTGSLKALEASPEMCASLAERLTVIDADGLTYKGLAASRDALVAHLRRWAVSG